MHIWGVGIISFNISKIREEILVSEWTHFHHMSERTKQLFINRMLAAAIAVACAGPASPIAIA